MFAIGIGSLLFIVQMRLDKTGEKEKAVGKSECFVFVGHRDKSSHGDPVLGGKRDQDVTQLGDVSSCYGDLYFWFWDDRPSKSQDLAKEEF